MYFLGDLQGNQVGRSKSLAAVLADGLGVRSAGKVVAASVAIGSAHNCIGVDSKSPPMTSSKRQVTPRAA